jgi:hypothetical protein
VVTLSFPVIQTECRTRLIQGKCHNSPINQPFFKKNNKCTGRKCNRPGWTAELHNQNQCTLQYLNFVGNVCGDPFNSLIVSVVNFCVSTSRLALWQVLPTCLMLSSGLAYFSILKMEATYSSVTSVDFQRTTRRHTPRTLYGNSSRIDFLHTLSLFVDQFTLNPVSAADVFVSTCATSQLLRQLWIDPLILHLASATTFCGSAYIAPCFHGRCL